MYGSHDSSRLETKTNLTNKRKSNIHAMHDYDTHNIGYHAAAPCVMVSLLFHINYYTYYFFHHVVNQTNIIYMSYLIFCNQQTGLQISVHSETNNLTAELFISRRALRLACTSNHSKATVSIDCSVAVHKNQNLVEMI